MKKGQRVRIEEFDKWQGKKQEIAERLREKAKEYKGKAEDYAESKTDDLGKQLYLPYREKTGREYECREIAEELKTLADELED